MATNARVMLSKTFVLKIALFNSLMFFLIVICDTYTSQLHAPSLSQLTVARLGYWVLLAVIPVFLGNSLLLLRLRRPFYLIFSPYAVTAVSGLIVSMIHFGNPLYHLHQMLAFALFPVPGLIATLIWSSPVKADFINDPNIPMSAKIECIKHYSGLWTTIAITGGAAFLAFIYFWLTYLAECAKLVYKSEGNRAVALGMYATQIAALLLYVILGPLYESFSKARDVNNLLLDLRNDNSKS
jgi:hypothetical protein